MNIKEALEVLGMETELPENELKKKYHKLALKYHPDKNPSPEANMMFQQINEAFETLKQNIEKRENTSTTSEVYGDILSLFLQSLFNNEKIKIITSILRDTITEKLFENIDKETLLQIYTFLIEYKDILYISPIILEKVKEIIVEKYNNVSIIILNPSLKDLLENNIYKLLIGETTYYIPLWHSEICLEMAEGERDSEIIVKCIPELPENVGIDEDNNLLINSSIILSSSSFPDEKIFSIHVDKYSWNIPYSQLCLKEKQTITLKSAGIPRTHSRDSFFDVSEKGDIIFIISISK